MIWAWRLPMLSDWGSAGATELFSTYLTASGGSADEIGFAAQEQNNTGLFYISAFQTALPT